jgi:hypothetical protein
MAEGQRCETDRHSGYGFDKIPENDMRDFPLNRFDDEERSFDESSGLS